MVSSPLAKYANLPYSSSYKTVSFSFSLNSRYLQTSFSFSQTQPKKSQPKVISSHENQEIQKGKNINNPKNRFFSGETHFPANISMQQQKKCSKKKNDGKNELLA